MSVSIKMESVRLTLDTHVPRLGETLAQLLTTGQFADVTLFCGGRAIRCHRFVLSTYSRTLEEALQTADGPNPMIFLKNDFTFETLNKLVSFMYTGEVEITTNEELDLFVKGVEELQIVGIERSDVPQGEPAAIEEIEDAPAPSGDDDDFDEEQVDQNAQDQVNEGNLFGDPTLPAAPVGNEIDDVQGDQQPPARRTRSRRDRSSSYSDYEEMTNMNATSLLAEIKDEPQSGDENDEEINLGAEEGVPNVEENVPDVQENVPDVQENVPNVPENVPDVPENVADVQENVPDVPENVPDVQENVPNVVVKATKAKTANAGPSRATRGNSAGQKQSSCRQDMINAIAMVKQGRSVKKAATKFNIPYTTLAKHIKDPTLLDRSRRYK